MAKKGNNPLLALKKMIESEIKINVKIQKDLLSQMKQSNSLSVTSDRFNSYLKREEEVVEYRNKLKALQKLIK